MSDLSFALVDNATGIVVTAGHAGSELQLQVQIDNAPAGHTVMVGVETTPGWKWTGKDFVPPPPPPVTINDVKLEQARRLRYTDGYITRAADPTDARPIPEAVIAERQAIRDGAHRLEAMVPIPPDYRDPKYWS